VMSGEAVRSLDYVIDRGPPCARAPSPGHHPPAAAAPLSMDRDAQPLLCRTRFSCVIAAVGIRGHTHPQSGDA
jgi:hypothetical protein